ncbi:hypothetical protein PAMP_007034 [Pampus punctatissimus]
MTFRHPCQVWLVCFIGLQEVVCFHRGEYEHWENSKWWERQMQVRSASLTDFFLFVFWFCKIMKKQK